MADADAARLVVAAPAADSLARLKEERKTLKATLKRATAELQKEVLLGSRHGAAGP